MRINIKNLEKLRKSGLKHFGERFFDDYICDALNLFGKIVNKEIEILYSLSQLNVSGTRRVLTILTIKQGSNVNDIVYVTKEMEKIIFSK